MANEQSDEDPIRMVGVAEEEVGRPSLDGSPGSGLYRVAIRLSRRPSATWAALFKPTWDRPPRFTTMHRPGIGSVVGDKIILDGTTIEEVERYHLETLRLVVQKVSADAAAIEAEERAHAEGEAEALRTHAARVAEISSRLRFD